MNKLKRNTNELEDLDDADIDEFLDFALSIFNKLL
jgi:hypothetical protein